MGITFLFAAGLSFGHDSSGAPPLEAIAMSENVRAAVVSAIVSAIVSIIVLGVKVLWNIRALTVQARRMVAAKLMDARLVAYPRLAQILSEFIKDNEAQHVTQIRIKELADNLVEWDNQHALLLGKIAWNQCYETVRFFVKEAAATTFTPCTTEARRRQLWEPAPNLESALRHDLLLDGVNLDLGLALREPEWR